MNKVHRKITALLTASFMTVMSMGVVSAQTDNNAQIKSIDAENGTVTVDVIKSGSYKIYAAVYKDKLLQGLYTVDSITSSGVFNFGKEIEFDEDQYSVRECLKAYITNHREHLEKIKDTVREYAELEGLAEDEVKDQEDKLVDEMLSHGKHKNLSFFAFTATPKKA